MLGCKLIFYRFKIWKFIVYLSLKNSYNVFYAFLFALFFIFLFTMRLISSYRTGILIEGKNKHFYPEVGV